AKLVIRRQLLLESTDLDDIDEKKDLISQIIDEATEEEFIVQDGDRFIFVRLDFEEQCILAQRVIPLIKSWE
ncbi:hypothetical protein, partial [Cylindrospermum sp. FACHB-282]|uniref:hypothetical protein n=1 Tax=Cylindrospermum sp. FACHB-282 TaxID=2692794 RepID=UPI001686B56B